jgi:hypothetical protein
MTVSSWYFNSWESAFFDILYTDSKIQRFKINIKPDLSDASLHAANMPETIPDYLLKSFDLYKVSDGYMVCEDSLVYFWINHFKTWGAFTGLTSAPFTNVVMQWNGHAHSLCPTSGRIVYYTDDGDGSRVIVVADLF